MSKILVTIGTDGIKDWVKTPNGRKFALGEHSILSFVTKLTPSSRAARIALDAFLKEGEAMLTVDETRLGDFFVPRRPRWASGDGPFMPLDQRRFSSVRSSKMSKIPEFLRAAEATVSHLDKVATDGRQDPRAVEALVKLGLKLAADEDDAEVEQIDEDDVQVEQQSKQAGLTFDAYEANMRVASTILDQARETVSIIDRLASAGKRFDSVRAKADVHAITTKVASICEKTALTEDWVQADLQKLAAESARIRNLFPKS